MTTSVSHPGARPQPGSPTAKAVVASAVIVLSTAMAGAALVAGIAAGSAINAPDQQPAQVTTVSNQTGEGIFSHRD